MNNSLDYIEKDFGKILKKNAQELRHVLLETGTDCFRVYDRNLEAFPVTVDLYGHFAKVTDFGNTPLSEELKEHCLDICSRMLYLEKSNVVYAYRAKREQGQQHEKSDEQPVVTAVQENGLTFKVDLTSHIDTGLFLDHAVTRQFIRSKSSDADVLNLFSYTGSFSVYAAAGLARSVTSVDMSSTYTKWAVENLQANGFSGENYKCVCLDAKEFVKENQKGGKKYDIIIFDPPAFSNSRKMNYDFDIARDWAEWIINLSVILKKTGFILFSTNLGTFSMDKRRIRNLKIKEVTTQMWAPGFVKGRNGTVRSWIMAFNDDSLSLDWSEPKKEAGKEHQHSGTKKYGRNEWTGERPRREFSDRRDSERRDYDRPRREYSDRRDSERRDYDRPRREYSDRRDSERRDYDRPRREFSDRRDSERRDYDRPRREFSDRRGYERRDYERRDSERRDYDRPRSFSKKKSSPKPYGYDSFKPARNRNDSSDFFWNVEDLEKKK